MTNMCKQALPVPEKLKPLEEAIIEAFSILDKRITPIIDGFSYFPNSLKINTRGVSRIGLIYWLSVQGDTIIHSGNVQTLIENSRYVSDMTFDAIELAAKSFGIKKMKVEDHYKNDPAALNVHERLFLARRDYTWRPTVEVTNEGDHPGEVPGYWVKKL